MPGFENIEFLERENFQKQKINMVFVLFHFLACVVWSRLVAWQRRAVHSRETNTFQTRTAQRTDGSRSRNGQMLQTNDHPFLKRTQSKLLIFECTSVYHNDEVYDLLRSSGIESFLSAGFTHRVKGLYPPNTHDYMPCELVNDRFKQMVRKNFSGRTSTENGDSALRNSQSC
jgi:C4-dicarboxylate-specific signal transduction histidine kinase